LVEFFAARLDKEAEGENSEAAEANPVPDELRGKRGQRPLNKKAKSDRRVDMPRL
jgi:hypothetical protein